MKLNKPEAIEDRKSTTNKIISMLAVNFTNEQDKILAIAEFGTFLREFSLTSAEVIEAYRMALKKELYGVKDEVINIYPNLSLIQAGEVLNAYNEYKIFSQEHSRGIEILRKHTAKSEVKETPEEVHENFIRSLYEEIKSVRFSGSAWLVYDDLIKSSAINPSDRLKRLLYRLELKIYRRELNAEISSRPRIQRESLRRDMRKILSTNEPLKAVAIRCKNLIVSHYLRNHTTDFNTFKKAFHGK